MVLKDVDSESDSVQPVTPMAEIRRQKGMLFDEFTRKYPDWEWSDKRRKRLMFDEQERTWVPMFSPEYGVGFAYDEPGYTRRGRRVALGFVRAGARGGQGRRGCRLRSGRTGRLRSVRYRVIQSDEAGTQLKALAPEPKRRIRAKLREMTRDPNGPDTLRMQRPEVLFRVREGDYRIIFRPGPGPREITVVRIGRRERVYEGLERPPADD